MCRIEETLPLLNILIPDFSLFWEFSAETWDTWDDEIAVICRDDESNTLYEDGEDIGMMDSGEIPGFPCLIVKNNERLKVCITQTRSGEKNYSYEFLHEEFDGSLTPATRDSYFEQDLEKEEPPLNFQWVATKEISPCVVKAYEEFKDFPQACQRDHIYYGLTKDKNTGVLNRKIREQIYKFRIDANAFKKMADQEGKDAFLQSTSEKKRYLTDEEILKRIWTDGKFEVVFKSFVAVENSPTPMEHRIAFSLDPRELFSISKVQVHHRNSTALRHSKNTYWVNLADLRSRTVVPSQRRLPNNVLTVPWDAYSHSLMFHLFVEEYDDSQTIEVSRTVTTQFSNKVDFNLDVKEGAVGAKLGYGFTHSASSSKTTKITTNVGSDDLGTLTFLFYDPVITKNFYGLFHGFHSVSNGTVEAMLVPVDLMKPKP